MDDAVEISQAIKRGNEFFRKIMTWDTKKTSVTRSNLEKLLNDFLAQFVRTIDADLSASLSFGDVHSKMNRKWHTELAYVEVANYRCHLLFDNTLAEQTDPHAGLIFIAKSWVLLFVLVKALSLDPNLQGSFVFEIGDNATLGEVGFSSSHPDACLILDYDFAASNGYEAYRQICDSQMIPWTQRLSKIFWRGSTTGRRLFPAPSAGQPDDFQWLSRLALCKACSEDGLAEICDVGITQLQQVSEQHLQARIAAAGFMRDPVPRQDFMKFRGAFDIDGNANAWSGLFCSLLGGSCVFKIESRDGFREWFYHRLVRWQNFVPISSDLSDIREAALWFANHQNEAELIAANGRDLGLQITTRSALNDSAENLIRWIRR